jgi:RNA polymerase sigma-70 factor (ECF subfamily)
MDTLSPDAFLVAAFAAGDREAGDQLFTRYASELRRFFRARCGDGDLAAELVQEVAARLVTAAPRLDPERNTRGYLFRVAQNVWRDHLRREIVRRTSAGQVAGREITQAPAADERVLEQDLVRALRHAVAALPKSQREVLELRQEEGITFREIAERLGRPLGTVLTQMRSALKHLSEALENYR